MTVFTREDMKPCTICGKGVMHSGLPLVWKIHVERIGIDARAVQREAGLEQMMGGNVAIARALSPESEFGQLMSRATLILCEPCAMRKLPPAMIIAAIETAS